jgi:outer membrane immunogenic protein
VECNVNTETTKFVSSTALLAAAAAVGAPGAASAADLVGKAPLRVPSASWEGFYVGGSLGVSWLQSDPDAGGAPVGYTAAGFSGANSVGFLGGLQAGYNWQHRNFVYGLEGDISFLAGGKATTNGLTNYGYAASKSSQIQGLGTFRARFGMDFDGTMPYVTGGIAVGSIKHTYTDTGYGSSSKTSWVPGLALGAGIEHKLTNNWSVKGELMWVGFRSTDLNFPTPYGTSGTTTFKDNLLTFKVGMNYRF